MKKIFKILKYIIIIWLVVWNFNHWSWYLTRNKFGYIDSSISLQTLYNGKINISDKILELKNEKFLALSSDESESFLYDMKNNKSTKIKFNTDLLYTDDGIILNDGRLLLINVSKGQKKYNNTQIYNFMAIINLDSLKVEQIIEKKSYKVIKKINKDNSNIKNSIYSKLGNGKIVIINPEYNIIETYNPNTNTSKVIISEIPVFNQSPTIIPKKDDKLLIFSVYTNKKYSGVLEYDDNSETIKSVGKVLARDYTSSIKKINANKILIMGGEEINQYDLHGIPKPCKIIEIYDIKKNKSKILFKTKYLKHSIISTITIGGHDATPINSRYILINCTQHIERKKFIDDTFELLCYTPLYVVALFIYENFYDNINWNPNYIYILDLKKHKIYRGPQIKKSYDKVKLFSFSNGNILIISDKETLLFKPKKGIRNK